MHLRNPTNRELEELAYHLALAKFKKCKSQSAMIDPKIKKDLEQLSVRDFIDKYFQEYMDAIKLTTIVEEYSGEILIFRTNLLFQKDDRLYVKYKRFYKKENEFIDAEVKAINLNTQTFIKKKQRNRKPSENSILKTLEIQKILNNEPLTKIDNICKSVSLPKSTFYKTKKWIANNSII